MSTADACEAMEIALERRAHGDALEPDLAASLDAHVASCERCRAYAATLALSSAGLASIAETARAGVDWEALEQRIRARPRERLARVLRIGALGLACVAISIAGLAPPDHRLLTGALMFLVAIPPVALRVAAALRERRHILGLTSREDVFAAERAYLARRIRVLRTGRWVALAVLLGLVLTGIVEPRLGGRVAYAVLFLFVGGIWLRNWRVTLPELERQAAELARRD